MTKLTTKSLVVYIVATAAVWAQSQPQDSSKSAAIFKQLKSLVGEWEAVQEGVPVKETYTLTANGSVLMSETKPADSEPMITMFTVDGDHLIATHYCVAGNQPQMARYACDHMWLVSGNAAVDGNQMIDVDGTRCNPWWRIRRLQI